MSREAIPTALREVEEGRILDVDVRDDLRSGREPFSRIMAAQKELQPDGVLRLRAIFEPRPLYGVMASHGLDHWTEQLADDDWRVWFWAADEAAVPTGTADAVPEAFRDDAVELAGQDAGDDAIVLDVRGLEPPEPMERTLAALEELADGATLVQINERIPRFLFPRLEERGFSYEVRQDACDVVRVVIRRTAPAVERVLDVRPIPPPEKHPAIFATFDALAPGESFVLVNDHDPMPLQYQFAAERTDMFSWSYRERGPSVWRVEIARTVREAS